MAQEILDLRGRVLVHKKEAPELDGRGPIRMPQEQRARLHPEHRSVRKNRSGVRDQPRPVSKPPLPLFKAMTVVIADNLVVEKLIAVFLVLRTQRAVQTVPLRKTHPKMLRLIQLSIAAPLHSNPGARTDAHQIHGPVAHVVVCIAQKIFRGEFPVAGNVPFLDSRQNFRSPFAPVAAIQEIIQMSPRISEVVEEGRRRRIPGRPNRALIIFQLGNLDQSPLRFVEASLLVSLVERNPD
jgi:hypothetical protein